MRRPPFHCRLSIGAVILATFLSVGFVGAEEVVIQGNGSERNVALGDYSCSPCFSKLASAYEFRSDSDPNTIEMTAGELWQFFDSQGHQSVSTLTLFVDVDQIDLSDSFNLSKLDIQIQSPDGRQLATDTKLGSNKLVVPGSETSGNRPEAELQFDLGYDFMQMFSSESTEIVRVSIDSPIGEVAAVPRFHLSASQSWGSTDLGTMFMFVLFWGVVFLVLLKWMRPARQGAVPVSVARKTPQASV